MIYKVYFSNEGEPATGLTLVWDSLLDADLGTDLNDSNAPAFTEIGGGWYTFELIPGTVPFDVKEIVGVIDGDNSSSGTLSGYDRWKPITMSWEDELAIDSTDTDSLTPGKAIEALIALVGGLAAVSDVDADTKRVTFKGRDGITTIVTVDVSTTTSGEREASTIVAP